MRSSLLLLASGATVSAQGGLLSDLNNLVFRNQQQQQQQLNPDTKQFVNSVQDAAGVQPGQDGVVTIPEYMLYLHSVSDMDLHCLQSNSTGEAQAWFTTSQKLRYILGADASFQPLDKGNTLEPALISILEDMGDQMMAKDYCGVGKLMVQLLSVLNVDSGDGEVIGEIFKNERIMSPLLTLLLDMPWMSYQPHWPLFGLLAQMAIRRSQSKPNHDILDGTIHPEIQQYSQALNIAILSGDVQALRDLSQAFLDAGGDAVTESPLAFLTAILTRAAVMDIPSEKEIAEKTPLNMEERREDARQLLFEAQKVMKKLVSTPEELDMVLSTRWPLWGMAYLASLKV